MLITEEISEALQQEGSECAAFLGNILEELPAQKVRKEPLHHVLSIV